jgi:hypothetical protein
VTLSHYCPTAASLLSSNSERGEGEQANIRVNPPMFPESGEYVGLDARTPLPPLLRPGLLMDWESWWLIERRAVDLLLSAGRSASDALNQLRLVISSILSWRPEDGPLGTRVNDAFRSPSARGRRAAGDLLNVLVNSVPGEFLEKTHWTPSVAPTDLVARRFLAAHAFANWPVHLGQGLRTWFLSIETAALLLHEGAGVSHADLLLRHLVDPRAWSTALDRTIGYNPLSS